MMPVPSPIAHRIYQALADHLKRSAETIDPRQSLRDDLGLDSMATIELLFRIEEAFDLQIPDDDLQALRTVGDVIAYIEGRVAQTSGAPHTKPSLRRGTNKKTAQSKKTR
jgi:acyl carrier protein